MRFREHIQITKEEYLELVKDVWLFTNKYMGYERETAHLNNGDVLIHNPNSDIYTHIKFKKAKK
jgi:hypothetical protein